MAINQDFPILDGIAPSWADVSCTVKGSSTPLLKMKDVASVETSSALEIGEMRGMSGGKVVRRTTGSSKHESKWSLYHSGLVALLENLGPSMLTRGGKRIYGVIHFDLQYIWTPPGSDEIFEKRVNGCRISGDVLSAAEGVDATQIETTLNPSEIIHVIKGIQYVIL